MRIIVGRHINGITLNDLEHLQDEEGDLITFSSEDAALKFLTDQGYDAEDLYWLVFKDIDEEEQEDANAMKTHSEPCTYCCGRKHEIDYWTDILVDGTNLDVSIFDEDSHSGGQSCVIPIKYCPNCGRKLEEKER